MPQRWTTGVQDRAQRELVKQMPGNQDGSPRGGAGSGDLIYGNPARGGGIVLEQANESVQVRSEEILAPEMRDDALFHLVALAEGFDEAEVLVAAVSGFDGAEEQGAAPKTLQ